ncbi:MAG: ATP-binding cassette domain-containing protein, partial [Sneathiella sp.]
MPETEEMQPILQIRNLSKKFVKPLDFAEKISQKLGSNIQEEVVHAVDDVSLTINKGEVVSLVGESGCGKSTLGRMVAGILPQTDGSIHYKGQNVDALTGA